MKAARTLRRFGMDVVLWYCVPALFLAEYVGHSRQPSSAIAPHLLLITLPLLALIVVRLLLQRVITEDHRRRWLVATLTALLFAPLVGYYALVIIGLRSWGGVVTWNVVPTLFAQTTVLTDSVGLPSLALPVATAVAFVAIMVLCRVYLERFDWVGPNTQILSAPTLVTIVAGAGAFIALEAHAFSRAEWTGAGEPLSLTLYPQKAALELEGYTVNPVTATHLDQLADRTRADYIPAVTKDKKNLVLIVVDALRPDHMGVYGYERDTTPQLARLTTQHPTRIIRGMHSTCGDTICALFSLFSSKFPREFSFRPFTLHEALRRNGYRIHLILSGDHAYFFSLRSIYGDVDTFYDGNQARDYFVNDDRLLLDRVAGMPKWDGKPTMFQFHLMSSHILRKSDEVPGKYQPAKRYALRNSAERSIRGEPSDTAVNFYDNGVLVADGIVNGLIEELEQKGYLRDALLVITADHGESLGEHGLYTHANSVHEEVLRIPLVFISYGSQLKTGVPPSAIRSQVDIAPSILTELRLPIPSVWAGRPMEAATGLPFSYFQEHAYSGVLDLRDPMHVWKYWLDGHSGTAHVFDLTADPHENVDRLADIPASLLAELRTHAQGQ